MSVESVKEYLAARGRTDVLESSESTATVALAAAAFGVEPERIAKTLSFRGIEPGSCVLVVTAGDARVNSGDFKRAVGLKGKMLTADEVEELTGHPVGGVCPFDNPPGATVYLDTSLQRFETVFPACGSANTAIEVTPEELFSLAEAKDWVTVTR